MLMQERRIDRAYSEDEWSERRSAVRTSATESNSVERVTSRYVSPRQLRTYLERVEGRFMGTPLNIAAEDAIMWAMRVSAGEAAYCDE